MFRIDIAEFNASTQEVLQMTQDIRVAKERTSAAVDAFFPNVAGKWMKTASSHTGRFKRKLSDLEYSMKNLSDAFNAANATIQNELKKSYMAVGTSAGASLQGSILALDESAVQSANGCHGSLTRSWDSLSKSIEQTKEAMKSLEQSHAIAVQIDNLQSNARQAHQTMSNTYKALQAYKSQVDSFEQTYASRLDLKEISPGYAQKKSSWISDTKDFLGVTKHVVGIGGFWTSIIDKSWKYKSSLPPLASPPLVEYMKSALKDGGHGALEGLKGTLDCFTPSKWKDAWNSIRTGNPAPKRANDNVADGVFGRTVIGKGDSASKITTRIQSGAKVIGYAGDVISVVGIGINAFKTGMSTDGDGYDKAAAGTGEAVKGATKFVVGKACGKAGSAIGATLGSAILPPVGTIVGGAIGGAIGGYLGGKLVDGLCAVGNIAAKKLTSHESMSAAVGAGMRRIGKWITGG